MAKTTSKSSNPQNLPNTRSSRSSTKTNPVQPSKPKLLEPSMPTSHSKASKLTQSRKFNKPIINKSVIISTKSSKSKSTKSTVLSQNDNRRNPSISPHSVQSVVSDENSKSSLDDDNDELSLNGLLDSDSTSSNSIGLPSKVLQNLPTVPSSASNSPQDIVQQLLSLSEGNR